MKKLKKFRPMKHTALFKTYTHNVEPLRRTADQIKAEMFAVRVRVIGIVKEQQAHGLKLADRQWEINGLRAMYASLKKELKGARTYEPS